MTEPGYPYVEIVGPEMPDDSIEEPSVIEQPDDTHDPEEDA